MLEKGIYLITDRALSKGREEEAVEAACSAGIKTIQYREKELPSKAQKEKAKKLQKICKKYGATFLVNDNLDVALDSGADGVHFGQSDLASLNKAKEAGLLIGISASNLNEAKKAEEHASYIGFGPVFPTPTKKDAAPPTGVKALEETVKSINTPIYAIGGINEGNVGQVMACGVHGAALISAVMAAGDFYSASQNLIEKVQKWI